MTTTFDDQDHDHEANTEVYLNEPGVYSLALLSPSPVNSPFLHWVAKEVLPSIRRTGAYTGGWYQDPDGQHGLFGQLAAAYNEADDRKVVRSAENLLREKP